MATSRLPIRRGRIVFVWIDDHRGHAKLRPALILNDDEISEDEPLVVMAITTSYPDPPPDNCVPLPWHAQGHPVTKLHRRSAAVIDWLATISPQNVIGFGGDVPTRTMHAIQQKLDQLDE